MIFVLRKFAYSCLALFLVSSLTFCLMQWIPGDPFRQEQDLPKEIYEALRNHYGLNEPLINQYLVYLKKIATFDLGPSFVYKERNVTKIIKNGLPVSAILGIEALTIAVSLGMCLGTLAALKQHQWLDHTATFLSILGLSLPSFILATLLQHFLSIQLGLFPLARWGSFAQTILPALSLAALPTAFIMRLTRAKLLEETQRDYIKTARAKGLSEFKILFFHAIPNAFIPILSYLGPLSAHIITGSFIIEKIFSIPGLGYWFVMSVLNRDYTLIMGITVFYCALLLTITCSVDLCCLWIDPRLSKSEENAK